MLTILIRMISAQSFKYFPVFLCTPGQTSPGGLVVGSSGVSMVAHYRVAFCTARTSSRNGSEAASSSQVTVCSRPASFTMRTVNCRRSGWRIGAANVWGRLKKPAEATSPSICLAAPRGNAAVSSVTGGGGMPAKPPLRVSVTRISYLGAERAVFRFSFRPRTPSYLMTPTCFQADVTAFCSLLPLPKRLPAERMVALAACLKVVLGPIMLVRLSYQILPALSHALPPIVLAAR